MYVQGGRAFGLAWQFVFDNMPAVLGRFPGGTGEAAYSLGRLFKTMASLFVDDSFAPQLAAFAQRYEVRACLAATMASALHALHLSLPV